MITVIANVRNYIQANFAKTKKNAILNVKIMVK